MDDSSYLAQHTMMSARDASDTVSVSFVTLGCPKNEVDTDRMKALVTSVGYQIAHAPHEADVIVVNTCSFITEAIEESLDVIFDLLGDEQVVERGSRLIVTGCMPSRFGADLEEELTEATAFLPADEEDRICDVIARLTGRQCNSAPTALPTARATMSESVYVKISEGCDRRCSFCTIPSIRGRYHSRPLDEICDEISTLVDRGAREVILVGQDTSIWGRDLSPRSSLAELLATLANRFASTWIRVLYIQPEAVNDELLGVIAGHDNICNYLDIPLQHASSKVLREMNRKGDAGMFLDVINRIRSVLPGCVLRTSLIAGFPGETEEEFEELYAFMEEARFDYAGVFVYSQEDGTPAGERQDQVPMDTRVERCNKLRDLCDSIGFERCADRVGEVFKVLFEGYEETDVGLESVGRCRLQAPDIDGGVHVPGEIPIGEVRTVRLVDSFCYEYEGELVS